MSSRISLRTEGEHEKNVPGEPTRLVSLRGAKSKNGIDCCDQDVWDKDSNGRAVPGHSFIPKFQGNEDKDKHCRDHRLARNRWFRS